MPASGVTKELVAASEWKAIVAGEESSLQRQREVACGAGAMGWKEEVSG
jgi:hypothetical protein